MLENGKQENYACLEEQRRTREKISRRIDKAASQRFYGEIRILFRDGKIKKLNVDESVEIID